MSKEDDPKCDKCGRRTTIGVDIYSLNLFGTSFWVCQECRDDLRKYVSKWFYKRPSNKSHTLPDFYL